MPSKEEEKKRNTEYFTDLNNLYPSNGQGPWTSIAGRLNCFCYSTSSLDRFNTTMFIKSTTTPASGVPLAVALTSDEKEETIYKALEIIKEVIPSAPFLGKEYTIVLSCS